MNGKKIVSALLGLVFVLLMGLMVGYNYYMARTSSNTFIARDIALLAHIFKRIHADCDIIGFEHDKNYIDFLNVRSFSGSEVGLMNLKRPDHWKGPYIKDNPTMQERYYMIVKTFKGYYIVPGDGGGNSCEGRYFGVRLANKKVIGKDIIFTYDTDIDAMMRDPEFLWSAEGALAAPLFMKENLKVSPGMIQDLGEDVFDD